MEKKIPVLLGPTSSGKTSLAIELCKEFDGSIISADSRQIYKYMDIGTGKIPVGEKASEVPLAKADKKWVLNGVDVWGYDLATPNDYFSSYDYANFALQKAKTLAEQGKTPFIVGGTGFYIDMVTGRVQPDNIKPDFELRESLENKTLEELQKQLMSLNPKAYNLIDQQNKVRLVRSIEKELSSNYRTTPLPYLNNVNYVHFGLTAPREILYERVDTWLDTVWQNGLLEEVHHLFDLGYQDSPKLQGLVYKSAVAFVNKTQNEEDAKQRAKYDLHAYIRRQQTYFKKIPEVTWFDLTEQGYNNAIKQFLDKTK